MQNVLMVAGHVYGDPALSYTPREQTAVLTLTVLVGPTPGGLGAKTEPVEYQVKVMGPTAEHAYDALTDGDRVIVMGTQRNEVRHDRITRERQSTVWLYADEIGPSLSRPISHLRALPHADQAVRAKASPRQSLTVAA